MENETPDNTKEVARRTIASAHVLKANIEELVDLEIGTTKQRELVGAYKALLLVIYQLDSQYIDI